MDEIKRMKELAELLNRASRSYYAEDQEIMSNYEYDKLYEELEALEKQTGTVLLDRSKSQLAVGVLQHFLDEYLQEHDGTVDYIHDDDVLLNLAAQDQSIGFLLPNMEKSQLFRGVIADGVLPRKTFSMGHAREKRYYLEGRKIR